MSVRTATILAAVLIGTAAVSAFLSWHAGRLVLEDRAVGMVAFASVPVWVCEMVLPLAFGLIALRYLLYAVDHGRAGFTSGRAP